MKLKYSIGAILASTMLMAGCTTEEQVRRYLKDRNFNIEFITKLEGAHLEYEKQSDHFNVEQAE